MNSSYFKTATGLLLLLGVLSACSGSKAIKPDQSVVPISSTYACPTVEDTTQLPEAPPVQLPPLPAVQVPLLTNTTDTTVAPPPKTYPLLKPVDWSAVEGWKEDKLSATWGAWLQGCSALINKSAWQNVCRQAQNMKKPSSHDIHSYFKRYFVAYSATNADGSDSGLITGYYQPILKGSRVFSSQYPYPIYRMPDDLITVELDGIYPELKYKRVRGRLVGNKLIPYYPRREIEMASSPLAGQELLFVADIIDLFFLHVQGSGVIHLDTGEKLHVGYANQNGLPYTSIGRILIDQGQLSLAESSMQGIKNWARANLGKLRDLLNQNPSYVFFRELPANLPGPLGALGVPILGEQVLAVDPRFVPLGAPVFLSTTEPNSHKPLRRLMLAQDTGGAIKGSVRADFYWGTGALAGDKAGKMKQQGKMWVLLPKDFVTQ